VGGAAQEGAGGTRRDGLTRGAKSAVIEGRQGTTEGATDEDPRNSHQDRGQHPRGRTEVKHIEGDLSVNWQGYRGVNTDEAEALLEDQGLTPRTWIWNAEKKHYTALLAGM
jgi:hypothetical protein